jgi:hypothetical protein
MKYFSLLIIFVFVIYLTQAQHSLSKKIDLHDVEFVSEELNINNIQALVNSNGTLFGELTKGDSPRFISGSSMPSGTDKSTILLSNLWITSFNVSNKYLTACNKYLRGPNNGVAGEYTDFFNGTSAEDYHEVYDERWQKIWKLSRKEISRHKENFKDPNYVVPESILNWPVHGELGQEDPLIVPFVDVDGDELYEPMEGDYPLIRGDESLFFIINDFAHEKTETGTTRIGYEIRVWVYGYDTPWDPVLDNTVFVHFDIYQKHCYYYRYSYIGIFNDFQIGDPSDDYAFTDVRNSSYIQYNADAYDAIYGAFPPAQSCTILAGPYALDNNVDDNDIDVSSDLFNGVGIGDGIVDNERLRLTNSFIYDSVSLYDYTQLPNEPKEYAMNLTGYFYDEKPINFGGSGRWQPGEKECSSRFMYTGDSDPDFFSTRGVVHNQFIGYQWYEDSVNRMPGNRQGLISSGPWALLDSKQPQEFDFAFVFAQSMEPEEKSSLELLQEMIGELHNRVWNEGLTLLHESPVVIKENDSEFDFSIFPNPTSKKIQIKAKCNEYSELQLRIYDMNGELVHNEFISTNCSVNISSLKAGCYVVQLINERSCVSDILIVN